MAERTNPGEPAPAPAAKSTALAMRPASFENRLFFAARNLAIEAMCLRIETRMLRLGFDVTAVWKEGSFGGPLLYLRLKNPKPSATGWEYAEATIWIDRDSIRVFDRDQVSECFYRVARIAATEHWPFKTSKYVQDFRNQVTELADDGFFKAEVDKVNYPFDYEHHSSF